MRRILFVALAIAFYSSSLGQSMLPRPKLVVGIVIDQMRWDYLYRYYDRYADKGGFKRLMNEGFNCENTFIPYTPTYTACGHSTIYTGSAPAVNGITGNNWWDQEQMRVVYCTEDKTVNTVGSSSALGKMSPRNMFVTTICDELRLATNFRSKVIGISIKDRGGILPAGHSANAAYWYDNTVGSWISSTYYMKELPKWVSDFNAQKWVDKFYEKGWSLLFPASSYIQSTQERKSYQAKPLGDGFPYDFKAFIGKDYNKISTTPMGNTLTTEFAKSAIISEQLGADKNTDFIAISYSSPDYIGHSYGPNSMESEDGFLRLDRELGSFLDFLDEKVGKGQYTLFLSADHGVLQIPEYLNENKIPAGRVFISDITKNINTQLKEQFKIPNIIVYDDNYQIAINHRAIDSAGLDKDQVIATIVKSIAKDSAVAAVFPIDQVNIVPLPATTRKMLNNSYYRKRCGDIQIILKSNYFDSYGTTGTTHGLWYSYDSHIPLLWYGWGIKKGKSYKENSMADIAPTLAALLNIQMPSGSVGSVITEVLK